MGGGKKNAGSRAAAAANEQTQLGIDQLDPFATAGREQLGGLAEGATIGGLDERLAQIFNSDTFGALVGDRERGVQSALSAGGLTRSGTGLESIANVGSELGLQLEQLLTGRSQGLASQGLGAAGGVANLFTQKGQDTSSGILADAQAKADFGGQVAKVAAGIFFSDERLKENVVEIGRIGDLGLNEWDWKDFTEGTVIADCPNMGFIAQEVKDKYPDFVGEESGWLFVDYMGLLDKLRDNLAAKVKEDAAIVEERAAAYRAMQAADARRGGNW